MSTPSKADAIREKAEQLVQHAFAPSSGASEEATIATAEGILRGLVEIMVRRVGVERAHEMVQHQADILDRVLLDTRPPAKPAKNICGND